MQLLLAAWTALDIPTVVAGHGYDFGGSPRDTSVVDDGGGGGGIGTASILAVCALAAVTAGVLMWLSPGWTAKLRSFAPGGLIAVFIATPMMLWTVSGDDEDDAQALIVERASAVSGAPELIVYLADEDINTLETSNGRRSVRVECRGRRGEVVIDAEQKWPFATEEEFDYPHVHQAATARQLEQVERCGLRGTRIRLQADVQGTSTGSRSATARRGGL